MKTKEDKINHSLVIGWLVIVAVLLISYLGEVVKGERTITYLFIFMIVTVIPAVTAYILYLKNHSMNGLRYYIVIGYFLMYLFCMITGSTNMVFSYILPMLSFLVLYHQPKLILYTGIASILINIVSIIIEIVNGQMTISNSKDAEIQIALLLLCFVGSYVATKLYDNITKENLEYTQMLNEKNNEIQKMTFQAIETIANTIDAKDTYTQGHSYRVAEYSAAIAKALGLDKERVNNIHFIALLHDIGKIGVPDSVLNKPGRLTNEEYMLMKQHTVIGGEILKDIKILPDLDIGAKYHHERYDGKGYPDGLLGNKIPYVARIIAVADAYDAMTTNRVYRKHLSKEIVLNELEHGKGIQFDPEICDVMIELIKNNKIKDVQAHDDENNIDDAILILSRVMEKNEEISAKRADLDELTGIYSRNCGERMLKELVSKKTGCLMIFDLDRFRLLNEKLGFIKGDFFLKETVECIKNLKEDIVISRFGSDEFVTFFAGVVSEEDICAITNEFFDKIHKRIEQNQDLQGLSVSVGVAVRTMDEISFSRLFQNADKALYHSKQQGGGSYYIYSESNLTNKSDNKNVDFERLLKWLRDAEQHNDLPKSTFQEVMDIYDDIRKNMTKCENRMQIVLFTLLTNAGKKVIPEETDRAMDILERAIAYAVPVKGMVNKFSNTQRIVMLQCDDKRQSTAVVEHILLEFYKMYDQKGVYIHYDFADLTDM